MNKSAPLLVVCAVIAGLVTANVTRPREADYERRIQAEMDSTEKKALNDGSILTWIATEAKDKLRSGRFQDGLLSTGYDVYVGGTLTMRCTGIFGSIDCKAA